MNAERLPEAYYLANFELVLADVEARSGDLLLPAERATIAGFRQLPPAAQRLYVRMLTRKGPWFRRDALRYPEIGDPEPPLAELVRAGFCRSDADLEELLPLLTRVDLAQALVEFGLPAAKAARRVALLDDLLQHAARDPLRGYLAERLQPASPRWGDLWRRLFLLFFGNFEQDLATFVLADTGRVRFESYRVDPGLRLFTTRADVDYLLSLRGLREQLEAVDSEAGLEILSDAALAMEAHPGVRQQRRFQRLLNDLGQAWERGKRPDRAMQCYARSERPPARERRARILASRGELEAAWQLALEMAEAPRDVAEARFARRFLGRQRHGDAAVERWLREHPQPEPPLETGLDLAPHPEGVERAALEAARAEGWDGFFAENHLWRALFGLVFWEDLFADLPGAFLHRFQNAPLDFGSADFYGRRQARIDRRLAEIVLEEKPAARILAMADRKWGVANAFVDWRHLDRSRLAEALARIEAKVLQEVLRIMVRNPRAFDRGFPDLFLFRPGGRDWKLWEVKGPGDSLRPEQEWWLHQFTRLGCDARVVRVRRAGGGFRVA